MRDLDELVLHELENTSADFKAIQYSKEKHDDLLVDVLAMANADIDGPRYIILGVKLQSSGQRQLVGIPPADFRDAATYQQLIRENIEPDLDIDYRPVHVEGVLVGVLIVDRCIDPPYLMKKDFGRLKRGDGFVRKGSHQGRLTRRDHDRMKARDVPTVDLAASLRVSFDRNEVVTAFDVEATNAADLPSVRAATRIRAILAERERLSNSENALGWRVVQNIPSVAWPGMAAPYEHRSTDELTKALKTIDETYESDDLYELFEKRATQLQLYLWNGGDRYVEDASFRLICPSIEGFVISERVYSKPPSVGPYGVISHFDLTATAGYPAVTRAESGSIVVVSEMRDVRHGLWTPVFGNPLRILIHEDLVGAPIHLRYVVHARNLVNPVEGDLTLSVT